MDLQGTINFNNNKCHHFSPFSGKRSGVVKLELPIGLIPEALVVATKNKACMYNSSAICKLLKYSVFSSIPII